jgi:uncharacterized membrane protein
MVNPAIAVPAVSALVYRAWSRKTLTPAGILAAFLTAVVHVLHPWIAPFLLLAVFYLAGSRATKVPPFSNVVSFVTGRLFAVT